MTNLKGDALPPFPPRRQGVGPDSADGEALPSYATPEEEILARAGLGQENYELVRRIAAGNVCDATAYLRRSTAVTPEESVL